MCIRDSGGRAGLDRRFLVSRQDIHRRGGVAHLGDGVIPDADALNDDLALVVGFKDNVIAVCAGNAERRCV